MLARAALALPLLAVSLAAPAPALAGPDEQASAFVPEEFVTHTLVLLRRGEAWTPEETPEVADLQTRHLAHLDRMWRAGHLVVAGPFDEQDDETLRGLCLYRVPLAEARALAEQDPAVQAGRLRVEAMTWWTGKGQLAFPLLPTAEVRGLAEDAKGGAVIVEDGGRVVYVRGLDAWPDDLRGQRVTARGALTEEQYIPEATVAPDGAISQGAVGPQWVLGYASWQAED